MYLDPLLETVRPYVAELRLGETADAEAALEPVLKDAEIFGVNLYEAGMAERVLEYFKELAAAKGAVRAVLKKYVR